MRKDHRAPPPGIPVCDNTLRNGAPVMASNTKNTNNTGSNDDDWLGDLVMSLFTAAGYLLWWAVLFPAISLPIVASLVLGITHGPAQASSAQSPAAWHMWGGDGWTPPRFDPG